MKNDCFIEVLGYNIFRDDLSSISFDKKIIIATLNAYSYVLAKKDSAFQQALLESDVLLPDGFPIVYACRILRGVTIKKIAGADIFISLMRQLDKNGGRVFFLGSSESTLKLLLKRVEIQFSNVQASCFSPPYKDEFSESENIQMHEAINNFKPDVVFVGMTAPKQEKWVSRNFEAIDVNIICSIGAVFDFYAGTVKRPSPFWIKLNLEWFVRLLREPKRLWKRYLIYSPLFIWDIVKAKLLNSK